MNVLQTLVNKTTSFLGKEQYENVQLNNHAFKLIRGTFNHDYDNAWFYEVAKGSHHLIDIGSNIGAQTILGFATGQLRSSLLVDANADALAIAAKNLLYNNLIQYARFYAGFVSDKNDDEVKFWTIGTGAAGSMYKSHAKTAHMRSSSYTVNTITVDSLVNHFSLQPDLVKIDVEGAEVKVLHGSVNTAQQYKPTYFVEMHSNEEISMKQNASYVLEWCQAQSYTAYYLKEHVVLRDPSTIQHRGRCHLLLLPKEKAYPDGLKSIKQSDLIVS